MPLSPLNWLWWWNAPILAAYSQPQLLAATMRDAYCILVTFWCIWRGLILCRMADAVEGSRLSGN
jgi:hypothetical protein